MADNNPYELAGRGRGRGRGRGLQAAPDRPARAASYTEAEQVARLEGYVNVPPDYWPFVRYSTHVRYIEKSGEFRAGGFVLKNPFDTKVKGTETEKRFLKLQNGFNRQARDFREWIVAYEDVEYLYAKADGVALTHQRDLQTAVTSLNANVQRLAAYSKKLEQRLAVLEGAAPHRSPP